ncbi:MAG: SDR family oxidoreductase [Mariprofundaceae bacterium]|nr:SDR family oxidoreductase [Mariprofundaceae bacterium]
MKSKVVVLGSLGMAGHIMTGYLRDTNAYQVVGVARQVGVFVDKVLDVTDFKALEGFLKTERPQFVINCVGALVSHAKENIASAILLNSYLPHFLSELGSKLHYKLIHISTDCVFSGKEGQYTEISYRDGDDNYARSKALGEVVNARDLIIRTSIIGPELKLNGTGLLDWFFKQTGEVTGYTQAYWSGVTTLELAKASHELIKQDIRGLYHLCPKDKISKYELLNLCKKVWEKDNKIIAFEAYKVDKSLVNTRDDFQYARPEYNIMLNELKVWMESHPDLYSHYSF